MSEWWQTFFDDHFLECGFGAMKRHTALRDVRFLEKVLALNKRARVLDVCCGVGRHAVELASKGYRVTGVDVMEKYIKVAAVRARRRNVKLTLETCDMRNLSYRREFDAAICMWTSFGYFERERDHIKSLRAIHRSLRPGGKFVIDLINRDWLIKNFQPYGWMERGKGFVLERRHFDSARSRINSEWVYVGKGDAERKEISIRVYSPHELVELLERSGFKVSALFGDRKNVMPTPEHRMLGVLAHTHK
jgi:SAM-dependent methyltransferase